MKKICGEGSSPMSIIRGCGKEYEPHLANEREDSLSMFCPVCVQKCIDEFERIKRESLKKLHKADDVWIWWNDEKKG